MDRGVKITFLNTRINAILAEINLSEQRVNKAYHKYMRAEKAACDFAKTCVPPINWTKLKHLDDEREQALLEYDAARKYVVALRRNLMMYTTTFEKQLSKMHWLWK
jgi:hypothetical protein